MTAATTNKAFKALAGDLAQESIVTQALARFLEQIFEEMHAAEIAPLQKRIQELEAALRRLLDRYHIMGCGNGPEALEAARVLETAEPAIAQTNGERK